MDKKAKKKNGFSTSASPATAPEAPLLFILLVPFRRLFLAAGIPLPQAHRRGLSQAQEDHTRRRRRGIQLVSGGEAVVVLLLRQAPVSAAATAAGQDNQANAATAAAAAATATASGNFRKF